MHHFFVSPCQVRGDLVTVEGSDVNHMRHALRMRQGELMEISDGTGKRYLCRLEGFSPESALLRVADVWKDDAELPSKIYLFQGLPKSGKMELIIQKAVELGVYEIIPVATKRAVVRLDEKKAEKKVMRWNAIAEGGAKQSGRSLIPRVSPVMAFSQALSCAGQLDVWLMPYEKAEGMQTAREAIGGVRPGQSVGVFIGPEGGFEDSEAKQAAAGGAALISLGRRLLRTETAGLAVLSILMYHLECDGHNL